MLRLVAALVLVSNFYSQSFAQSQIPSQVRTEGEDYREVAWRYFRNLPVRPQGLPGAFDSAYDQRESYSDLDITELTSWRDHWFLEHYFSKIRDERFIEDPQNSKFLRRITWLYPDDGCYARAALFAQQVQSTGVQRPTKVFVFGNLTVKTTNSPFGQVSWWYHVAPIVNVSGQAYVIDAAIDPQAPMPLLKWLQAMTEDVSTLEISFCSTYSYEPGSSCWESNEGTERGALRDQRSFLDSERVRLEELGRNPDLELSDQPPWKNPPPHIGSY